MKRWLTYSFLVFFLSCGGNDHSISVLLSPTSFLQDPSLVDMIGLATNVPGLGGTLDSNHDGSPDQFGYPSRCGTSAGSGCGIPLSQAGTFSLGKLPLGYTYNLKIELRNQAGCKYAGSTQFDNTSNTTSVSISLSALGC